MRLIDADKLLKDIMSQKILGDTTARIMDKYINVINNQPTAYDIDKVVEELEEESEIALEIKESGIYAGLQSAIEIVKQGVR